VVAAVHAESGDGKPRGGMQDACVADMQSQCGAVDAGKRGQWQCLFEKEKEGKLSAACSSQLQRQRAIVEACASDTKSLCGDTQGHGDIGKCMREKREQLSAACRNALEQREHRRPERNGS